MEKREQDDAWESALNGPPPSGEEKERAAKNFAAVFQQIQSSMEPAVVPLKSRRWWRSAGLRAACMMGVIIACGGAYLYYKDLTASPHERPIAWEQVNTKLGERSRLKLGDGTIIYMNGGSSLKYPKVFASNKREVELVSGEIFLEVAPNEAMPFMVKTDSLSVQVLGTSFTVSNKPDGDKVTVAVKTGRVAFGPESKLKLLLLTSGREGVFHKKDGDLKELTCNTDAIAGWTKNEFIFEDASLAEVLNTIEKSYGYGYKIENKTAAGKLFRASFNQHSPEEIIHTLSVLGNFKYVIRDSTIIIK